MLDSGKRRAIFLDRDGVINENRPNHVKNWDEFVFLPHAADALRRLAASDFLAIVVTNQSAIHCGLLSESTRRDIDLRMSDAITRAEGRIDAIYFCPHTLEKCECRKPRTKMYREAARAWRIDFSRSYVVGDAITDILAAQAIGATPILVLTGRSEAQYALLAENHNLGFHVARDLWEAVEWIWEREEINGG